jgi:hypothetical protein
MLDLAAIARGAGLRTVEVNHVAGGRIIEGPGWRKHAASGSFAPIGVMNHHDALKIGTTPAVRVNLLRNGRSDLPGPLCNIGLGQDGTVYVIAGGRANDSGTGNQDVLDRIRAGLAPAGDARTKGTVNGNAFFYDIEWANNGVGEAYPDVQLDAGFRLNAALLGAMRRPANSALEHREWTNRKIDRSHRGRLREPVALHMLAMAGFKPAGPPPPPIKDRVGTATRLHLPELRSTLMRIPYTFALDDHGRAWKRLDGGDDRPLVPFGRLVSVRPQGSHPVRDKGYWPLVETGEQDDGGMTLLTVEGGVPSGVATVFLHVAEAA